MVFSFLFRLTLVDHCTGNNLPVILSTALYRRHLISESVCKNLAFVIRFHWVTYKYTDPFQHVCIYSLHSCLSLLIDSFNLDTARFCCTVNKWILQKSRWTKNQQSVLFSHVQTSLDKWDSQISGISPDLEVQPLGKT